MVAGVAEVAFSRFLGYAKRTIDHRRAFLISPVPLYAEMRNELLEDGECAPPPIPAPRATRAATPYECDE